jgi:hypothetical protein
LGFECFPHDHNTGIKLRKSLWQLSGPRCSGSGPVAGMGVGHRYVEPVEQLKKFANIRDYTGVGV